MTTTDIPGKMDLIITLAEKQTRFGNALLKANAAKMESRFSDAIEYFDDFYQTGLEIIRLSELHNQHYANPVEIEGTVKTLLNGLSIYGDILQSSGDLHAAEEIRDTITQLVQQYLGSEDIAEVERSRAASLISQGRFNEALIALTNARDQFQAYGNALKQSRVTLDMVDILHWLGDFERAGLALKEARLAVQQKLKHTSPSQSSILKGLVAEIGNIMSGKGDTGSALQIAELYRIKIELDYYQGLISRSEKDWDLAEDCFNKVLPEYTKLGVGVAIEYQLAAVELGRGHYQNALDMANRLEPSFYQNKQLRPKLGGLLRVEGDALLNLGRADEALKLFEQGVEEMEIRFVDPDLLWRLYAGKAGALEQLGRDKHALAAYVAAAEVISNLRKAPLGYRLDSLYLADKMDLFHRAVTLSARLKKVEQCARLIELIKSRTLTATLDSGKEKITSSKLSQAFEDISRQLDQLEYQGFHEGDAGKYKDRRQQLLQQRAEILERIRFSDERWRTLTTPRQLNLVELQKHLSQFNQAVLSLFQIQDSVVVILITPDKSAAEIHPLQPETLKKLAAYGSNLNTRDPDRFGFDPSLRFILGAKHLVPEHLLDAALACDSLAISPHGSLHLLPWAGLIFRQKRLFEYCPITVLPNLGCVFSLSAALPAVPKAAVFGPPEYGAVKSLETLPDSLNEVKALAKIYSAKKSLRVPAVTGDHATSEMLVSLLRDGGVDLLHISCHGVFEDQEPMNSGLLLADAKLDAAEIQNIAIQPREIVLSACSTGWRPAEVNRVALVGDDILGLPGAFLEGGAKMVLVSIPTADDNATANLMQRFHGNRASGLSPARAFQAAQIEMLKTGESTWKWIGFTMYGAG